MDKIFKDGKKEEKADATAGEEAMSRAGEEKAEHGHSHCKCEDDCGAVKSSCKNSCKTDSGHSECGCECDPQEKLAGIESRVLLLAADFDNYRKRMEKEKCEIAFLVEKRVCLDLISINDVLEKALKVQRQSKDASSVKGFEMVYSEFQNVLKKYGVEKQVVLGKKFNPLLHNAATTIEGEKDDDLILEEIQPGYLFSGQLLRPAMVIISKKKGK